MKDSILGYDFLRCDLILLLHLWLNVKCVKAYVEARLTFFKIGKLKVLQSSRWWEL